MASYEEFEAWYRASSDAADPDNFTGDLLSGRPVAEFGVQLIVGDDPLPSRPNPQIQEGRSL